MAGVLGAYKIEKKFWENLPKGVDVEVWADRWFMNMIDWALTTKKELGLVQVVEVHKAWQSTKKRALQGVATIRIVAD